MNDVYFDLDGTLTDPYEGITRSIVYALERLGEPAPDEWFLRQSIGPPLLDTFAQLVGGDRSARALELYRERFVDVGWKENIPYDGIHDTLKTLAGAGHRLFVATSKPHVFARRIADHFEFAEYFDEIFGSELDGRRTDKTALLKFALQKSGSHEATMIGDRKHDVIGAINNNMGFVGVSYGYGSEEELRDAGATRLAASPAEITECLCS